MVSEWYDLFLQALVELLQSAPFVSCSSIIIYCTRQQTTDRVAQLLRTALQDLDSGYHHDDDDDDTETPPTTGKGKGVKRSLKGGRGTKRRKSSPGILSVTTLVCLLTRGDLS